MIITLAHGQWNTSQFPWDGQGKGWCAGVEENVQDEDDEEENEKFGKCVVSSEWIETKGPCCCELCTLDIPIIIILLTITNHSGSSTRQAELPERRLIMVSLAAHSLSYFTLTLIIFILWLADLVLKPEYYAVSVILHA